MLDVGTGTSSRVTLARIPTSSGVARVRFSTPTPRSARTPKRLRTAPAGTGAKKTRLARTPAMQTAHAQLCKPTITKNNVKNAAAKVQNKSKNYK